MTEITNVYLIQNSNIKRYLQNSSTMQELSIKLDQTEKNKEKAFSNFTDIDMLKWYLYERKHVNEKNERTERTILEYERELTMFIEQILQYGDQMPIDIAEVTEGSLFKTLQKRHLRRYQEWLVTKSPYIATGRTYSPATLERKTTIIKSFFSFLFKVGYIEAPIYEGLRIASVRKDDRPNRDLGPNEVVRLLNTFKQIDHPIMFGIIHVLTTTGIRNEEFCRLTVGDLKEDMIGGNNYIDVLGKGNKRRHVPLRAKVFESILQFRQTRGLQLLEHCAPHEPLFTTNTGRAFTPSYLSQYVKNQIKKHGTAKQDIKITPHVFRHAFAIISRINGVDIYDIMRSLGHEKIETTMIYLEKVFEKERHAIHAWKAESFGEYI